MALHLIKMAAGITSLEMLDERQEIMRALERPELGDFIPKGDQVVHITRFFPKRRDEILTSTGAGRSGSLFWVFQKRIQARQRITDFIEVTVASGESKCGIVLEGPLVAVEHYPRKAFQGWRYLDEVDAPPDLVGARLNDEDIPPDMRADLEALCLI